MKPSATSDSQPSEPEEVRSWITEVNSGIVAVAGMGLGLSGADVNPRTSFAIVCINIALGALTVLGVKLGERYGDREAELDLIRHESANLEHNPDAEKAELIAWFEDHGVSPQTARAVTEELSAGDSLGAQLRIEYGITEYTTPRAAWIDAAQAALAFLVGAALPLLTAIIAPWNLADQHLPWITGIAALSLVVTSLVLSRRGKSDVRATILRSLLIGVTTIAITFALGELLF